MEPLHLQQFGIELCQNWKKTWLVPLVKSYRKWDLYSSFPSKIHRRRVSFVTNMIITILVKICCIETKFFFEFCFYFIYQSFCKSVLYWCDKNKPICCRKNSKNGNCFENFVCKNQLVTFSKRRVSFCNSHIVTNIKLWFLYQFCWIVCIYRNLSRHMYLRDVVWSYICYPVHTWVDRLKTTL